ncbi:MAG: GNAT family N-acetyltransferase [Sulfolobales archaeon]
MEIKKAGGVFYVKLEDGSKAYVATETEGGVLKVLETYVPEKHRGKGYARALLEKVVEYAKSNNLKVQPICSYAISYFMKNKEARDVLVDELKSITEDEWQKLYEERLDEEEAKRTHLT